jgi:nucleoid-associated protein YgaU
MQYKAIHEANRDVIGDNADVIHPGQALRLPFPG